MQICQEFENNYDILIGKFGDTKYGNFQYAPIYDKNTKKQLSILTPELKQKHNTQISGFNRKIYFNMVYDDNLKLFIDKFTNPLTNSVSKSLGNAFITTINFANSFTLKFNEINLSILDYFNNITERKLSSTSINNNASDINHYINFSSKFKFIITPSVWKINNEAIQNNEWEINNEETQNNKYGIIYTCTDILIINGVSKKESIITSPKVFETKHNNNNKNKNNENNENNELNNKNEIKIQPSSEKLFIQKHKINNTFNAQEMVINL